MAIIQMDKEGVQGETGEYAWEASESLAAAGNGSAIIMPRGIAGASVTVISDGAASAKVQATTSKINDVTQEKATVKWVDWDAGAVLVNTQDYVMPCTAIRLVQAGAGATSILVHAQ